MPFDNARSLQSSEGSGLSLKLVEAAVAEFKSSHPYLLFDRRALPRIRRRANGNPKLLARLEESLREESSGAAEGELRTKVKRRSRRLIHTSFLALIGEGTKKADALHAARTALSEFAAETSWKARPVIKSFLDCAEIAAAVSLAYDWLYHEFTGDERQAIEASLFRNVLEPALAAYDDPFALWPKRRDNCTLVSNSGILVASIAVLPRHPEISVQLIQKSLASSWRVFDSLAPDGAWPEGPSYWSLAMRYAGLMVAALESAFDQGFGLESRPGFAQTGDFALHAVGPFGVAFNFGDSEPRFDVSPLSWFAHRFKRAVDARLIEKYDGWYLPFTVIWSRRSRAQRRRIELPTGKIFDGGNLACFRNTWSTDPKSRPVYVAIKGGNIFGGGTRSDSHPEDLIVHAQADAGSFIVDGAKQRWVIDLGPDDYDLPGYFDHGADKRSGPRWRYYRTQAAGHNTLVIDGRNQIPNAPAPIIGNRVDGRCKWAVLDLSAAYGKPAGSIRRGAALIDRQVIIQDEVDPEVAGTIVWALHTSAEPVSVAGSVARFRLGCDQFVVRILEPSAACFEIGFPPAPRSFPVPDVRQLHGRRAATIGDGARVSELPRRADDNGKRAAGALIRRLEIIWPRSTRRLCVALLPDCDNEDPPLPVTSLSEWLARRPVRLATYSPPKYRTKAAPRVAGNQPIGFARFEAGYAAPAAL